MEKVSEAISGKYIKKAIDCRIILYNSLKHVHNIDQVFKNKRFVFILYEYQPDFGHWVVIIKRDNGDIEFFDSYGYKPDDESEFVKKSNYWEHAYLIDLLIKSGKTIHYNPTNLQGEDTHKIATCGRWCLLRCYFYQFSISQFTKFFYSDDVIERNLTCVKFLDIILKNKKH